jgi:primosomal protein N''
MDFDFILHQHIAAEVTRQLPKVISAQLQGVKPLPEWMTEMQLAEYWQLRNKEGEITVYSIRTWTARPRDEHPLPCANMGEMRRYNRAEVDRWAREEAELQRAKSTRKGRYLKAVE